MSFNRRSTGEDSGPDLISDLPDSIIEIILTKLPIRDAVKTSILSTKWRYKWATIIELKIDEKCFPHWLHDERKLVKFITRLLLLHQGPIHKFQIANLYLDCYPEIDQWLLVLSRNDIKELVLQLALEPAIEWYQIPSCLFNCKKLTHLELNYCCLNPPLNFKGFKCLKSLILSEVYISAKAIEILVSSCPLLESLSLIEIDFLVLRIRAPNLKCLYLRSELCDICLEDTPLLIEASIDMNGEIYNFENDVKMLSFNFIESLNRLPTLESLIGHSCFTKYLSLGNFARTRPTTYNLKIIELGDVSFVDLEEIRVVLRLITNSPNLEQLYISRIFMETDVDAPDFDLKKECTSECTLKHLEIVELEFINGIWNEIQFIKFLLGNSPVLKSMTIMNSLNGADKRKMFIELKKVRWASARAAINIIHLC
ncbi:hypothetical protein L6164_025269 [Bauhinia variegata]|uniref:Uncharacterized protein n=1 Tax=Bauhinia variegata TaxID=167791 RepID=A0ACB9M0X4_BAUVA|nr:hypothetical protein L6164_025269 [Bauhinia variegata]